MVDKQKTPQKPLKQRKSRVNPDKARAYLTEYYTNGHNKTQAHIKANPKGTYENNHQHSTQFHRRVTKSDIGKQFETERREIIEKAWRKVRKALDKETDKADTLAKDIAVKDMRDNAPIQQTTVYTNADITELKRINEGYLETTTSDNVDYRTLEGKAPIDKPIDNKSEGI